MSKLNRRSVLHLLGFAPIMLMASKLSIAESPFLKAPLLVIPAEVGNRITQYRRAYGKDFWVVTDDTATTGYRASRVVLFGFKSLPIERQKRVEDEFKTRLIPGGIVEHW